MTGRRRRRRRRRSRRAAGASQWLIILAAASMLVLAFAVVLDRSAQRMGLLDRIFTWLAARAGAEHAQRAALDSPLVIALALGAAALLLLALVRAWRS
ncbi:MAG: hypothetical protein ACIARR_01970 [Phycisphaerales bacterium JB059]